MGPTWDLTVPDEPHVGPMNFAIWDVSKNCLAPQTPRETGPGGSGEHSTLHTDYQSTTEYIRCILQILQEAHQGNEKDRISNRRRGEWMLFGYIMDHAFFVIFVSLGVIFGLVILLQYAYNPQKPPGLTEIVESMALWSFTLTLQRFCNLMECERIYYMRDCDQAHC